MTGSGVDDYIWISPYGTVTVFLNQNTVADPNYEGGTWGVGKSHGTNFDRRRLHIGDWNGDGKADIIGVSDRDTGALRVWLANGDGGFGEGEDIEGSDKCNQGWGRLYFDHGAHFADIT